MLLAAVEAVWQFLLVYGVLGGVGFAGSGSLAVTVLISRWFVAAAGSGFPWVFLGINAGQLTLVPLGGLLIDQAGHRAAYLALGLPCSPSPPRWSRCSRAMRRSVSGGSRTVPMARPRSTRSRDRPCRRALADVLAGDAGVRRQRLDAVLHAAASAPPGGRDRRRSGDRRRPARARRRRQRLAMLGATPLAGRLASDAWSSRCSRARAPCWSAPRAWSAGRSTSRSSRAARRHVVPGDPAGDGPARRSLRHRRARWRDRHGVRLPPGLRRPRGLHRRRAARLTGDRRVRRGVSFRRHRAAPGRRRHGCVAAASTPRRADAAAWTHIPRRSHRT